MKHILTGFSRISAWALLALVIGCASSTPTANVQNMLIAAGFTTITPRDAAQQQKLQALPPGQLAQITKNGQTFYVFPDAANNLRPPATGRAASRTTGLLRLLGRW